MKRFLKLLIWPVILTSPVYLWLSWNKVPASVPMHYNLRGEIDRYGSKNELIWLVLVLAVVSIGTYLLLVNTYRLDPKKTAGANRERMQRLAFGITFFISALSVMMVYYSIHPPTEFRFNLVLTALGLLLAFIGNYMHNIKPNYFAGLRLPWTLENEDNWRLTHALAGKLWFAGGLVIAIIALVVASPASFIIVMVIVASLVLIPAIYSYRLFRKKTTGSI